MGKKNDLYIDYKRSYQKRGRRGGNKGFKSFLILVLAIMLGLLTYYMIRSQINLDKNPNKTGSEDNMPKSDDSEDANQIDQNENFGDTNEVTDTGDNQETSLEENQKITQIPNEANNKDEPKVEVSDEDETSPDPIVEVDKRIPVKVKGIYVTSTAARTDKREALIDIVNNTEINAMVIDVKDDHGKITYSMDSEKAREIGAVTNAISDMESLIRTLKEQNIYLIARIVCFKDPYLAEQRPDLAIRNKDGSLYRDNRGDLWVNPYKHEVWEYLVEVSSKAAAIGFDEIQFDYIRFSTGKGMNEVDFGEGSKEKTKEDIILEYTKYAYESLKPLGVFVSADVYGTIISSSIDAGLVGQNYVEMSRYLDYISPMIYPSHFGEGNYGIAYPDLEPLTIVRKVLTASKAKLDQIPEGEHRAVVRPWLQDFTASWLKKYKVYGGAEVREQIDGVYAAGYEEWILWNASCNYSVDGLIKE